MDQELSLIEEQYRQHIGSNEQRYSLDTKGKIEEFYRLLDLLKHGETEIDEVYDMMIDIATDFEESGFCAGYRFCSGLNI